jgi:hypothetical protein
MKASIPRSGYFAIRTGYSGCSVLFFYKTPAMYKFLLTAFFAIATTVAIGQTKFKARDLNGIWVRDNGFKLSIVGVGIFTEAGNPRGEVLSVGNSPFPPQAKGGMKYNQITYLGDNKWQAEHFSWHSEGDIEKGYWKSFGNTVITMSEDKNSFNDTKATYKRQEPLE